MTFCLAVVSLVLSIAMSLKPAPSEIQHFFSFWHWTLFASVVLAVTSGILLLSARGLFVQLAASSVFVVVVLALRAFSHGLW